MTTKDNILLETARELRRHGPCLSCEVRKVFFQLANNLEENIQINNWQDSIFVPISRDIIWKR